MTAPNTLPSALARVVGLAGVRDLALIESRSVPVPEAGCWLWLGTLGYGYGMVHIDRKPYRAHRYAYECVHGPIEGGLHVCHKCDTRSCVNPDHLFLGTAKDNVRDMVRKGRHLFGARNPATALNDEIVREIFTDPLGYDLAGEKFGVNRNLVRGIRKGHTWNHVTGLARTKFRKPAAIDAATKEPR